MAVFDLHLHTCWSYDGFSRAADYFRFAEQKKVRAIAVTDHHLMDSCGEVLRAAAEYPEVGYILGAELTVHCPLGTFDLVCLNLLPVTMCFLKSLHPRLVSDMWLDTLATIGRIM